MSFEKIPFPRLRPVVSKGAESLLANFKENYHHWIVRVMEWEKVKLEQIGQSVGDRQFLASFELHGKVKRRIRRIEDAIISALREKELIPPKEGVPGIKAVFYDQSRLFEAEIGTAFPHSSLYERKGIPAISTAESRDRQGGGHNI